MVEPGRVVPEDPLEKLRRELDEAYATVRALRDGVMSPFIVDFGNGPDGVALRRAERRLEGVRRDLEDARDTLQMIWDVEPEALVIDADDAEEVMAPGQGERARGLLVDGMPAWHRGSGYLRAVAVDFDGTLAEGTVAPDTLAALAEARARGIRVILVTGRIMSELRQVFPDVGDHLDGVVAENGGLLVTAGGVRDLGSPVAGAVSPGLSARGVAHRCGEVIVACAGADESAALEVIRGLGLDCQLVRNRDELMIMPAGVTKGSGLLAALGEFGLSPHNALAVGDAENDHTLLDVCEIGVAVSNAVEAIRDRADLTLTLPDGEGVADLLRGPLLAGRVHLHPRRWEISLGVEASGERVSLPASQLNLAIWGSTGDGKSYLAGMICEQLVGLGYSLVVFDPEGDHVGLGELRGVLVTGGHDRRLADPAEVVRLLRHRDSSVVVDLSHLGPADQAAYAAGLTRELEARRAATGLPQWVVIDEAHVPIGRTGAALGVIDPASKGYLLVTWRPQDLSGDALAGIDAVIALGSRHPEDPLVELTAAVADMPRAAIARMLDGPPGHAVLGWRVHPRHALAFTAGSRNTPHLRHEHKYERAGVEPGRRFYFRAQPNSATGAVAANLLELEDELGRCEGDVLRHHCPGHDFSRWVSGVFHEESLASVIAAAEAGVQDRSAAAVVEQARVALIAALQSRHSR